MAGRAEVHLNIAGIRELLKSAPVQSFVLQQGNQVAGRLPHPATVAVTPYQNDTVVRVGNQSTGAMRREADHGDLARALGAGGAR